MCVFILLSPSSLIIHINASLYDTIYCTTSFYSVQLTMDDGSSETCQPDLLGRFPAGNPSLSFAVLCAGASVSKVLLVFPHMGLLVYHEPTYYYHQRHLLIPSVVAFWRKYQKKLLDQLKNKEVVMAGDGRHDSMGHSAKYGTYTIFCCTIGLILHIVLVQVFQFSR